MITIRKAETDSKLRLVCLDVTLKTSTSAYTISSEQPMIDSGSPFGGGLFGSISWPVSRFRFAEGSVLEQQMFLPCDESSVAVSWALHGDAAITAQLVVRPFFSGCGPRSYRDVDSALIPTTTGDGLLGCHMYADQKFWPIPMANITMNPPACSIAFLRQRRPQLQNKT